MGNQICLGLESVEYDERGLIAEINVYEDMLSFQEGVFQGVFPEEHRYLFQNKRRTPRTILAHDIVVITSYDASTRHTRVELLAGPKYLFFLDRFAAHRVEPVIIY